MERSEPGGGGGAVEGGGARTSANSLVRGSKAVLTLCREDQGVGFSLNVTLPGNRNRSENRAESLNVVD